MSHVHHLHAFLSCYCPLTDILCRKRLTPPFSPSTPTSPIQSRAILSQKYSATCTEPLPPSSPPLPPLPPQFNSVDLLSRSRNIVERIRWFLSTWFNYIHLNTRVSLGSLFMASSAVTQTATALLWKKTALLWRKLLPYEWHKHKKAWTVCIYWLFAVRKLNKINTMLREYSLLFLFALMFL